MNHKKSKSRPLTQQESEQMHRDSLENLGNLEAPAPDEIEVDQSEPYYSDHCKVKAANYLKESLVVEFNELLKVTGDTHYAGALLVEINSAGGGTVSMWLPKNCCCNLDLQENTVCVWDQIMNKKVDEVEGFLIEPEYYHKYHGIDDADEDDGSDCNDGGSN